MTDPIADAQQRGAETERAALIRWIDKAVMESGMLMMASGIPGGTKTQRVKARATAAGIAHASATIRRALIAGDHRKANDD